VKYLWELVADSLILPGASGQDGKGSSQDD
jgi:hypothetical protein